MIRIAATTIVLGLLACACGPQQPAISPQLDSGVNSSNGGGQRTLNNLNQLSIGPNGVARTSSDQAGRAY